MGQSKYNQRAVCACGASHPKRTEAVEEGWISRGTQVQRVWHCPSCAKMVREKEDAAFRENLRKLRPLFRVAAAVMDTSK